MSPSQLRRRLLTYCQRRLTPLAASEIEHVERYICTLIDERRAPPRRKVSLDWRVIADETAIDHSRLIDLRPLLSPPLEAIARAARDWTPLVDLSRPASMQRSAIEDASPSAVRPNAPQPRSRPEKRLASDHAFADRLDVMMRDHGHDSSSLHDALVERGVRIDRSTLVTWRNGSKSPRAVKSLSAIRAIERLYDADGGTLETLLPHPGRAAVGLKIKGATVAESRRLAWHLPSDFNDRPKPEQAEILDWVRNVIIAGATDYRRYQAAASRQRFGFRFVEMAPSNDIEAQARLQRSDLKAPDLLQTQMSALVRFKTATLTERGYKRNGVWGPETTDQKIEHLGLMFGSLAADADGPLRGLGVPREHLSLGLLIFPALWDWYLTWRSSKRGFFTSWESDMLGVAIGLTRKETGWIRQTPELAAQLFAVPGIISEGEIEDARADWDKACDVFHDYAMSRAREIQRISRVHRDPFEPIMCILEADSPVGEYTKIATEILKRVPDERLYPRAAAEAIRSFLLIRLGLHLGIRQKNLRQLRVRARTERPSSERELSDAKCGELRWSDRSQGWEVVIPSIAFKNAHSSFFGGKPFRLVLPDLGGLYGYLEAYIERHRAVLLNGTADPGTLFVKTTKMKSKCGSYNQNTFYEAWRLTIQRYGVYNPYTGRGAIEGLLPHGPHNVRDVLATHILKRTGSYEQASYAIQDTAATVADHYGRFLPQDKAALAAEILNQVWAA